MTKSELENIRHLNDLINGGIRRIADLKSKAYPGAIVYDDTGGSRPAPSNRLEMVYAAIDLEERRVNRLIDRRYAAKARAIKEIRSAGLECAERHVLYLRYLATDPVTKENLTWPTVQFWINKYHNIQERKIYKLHHNALSKLNMRNI